MIIYQNVGVGECMVRHKSVLYQAQPKLGIGHPIVVAQWRALVPTQWFTMIPASQPLYPVQWRGWAHQLASYCVIVLRQWTNSKIEHQTPHSYTSERLNQWNVSKSIQSEIFFLVPFLYPSLYQFIPSAEPEAVPLVFCVIYIH